MMTRLPLALIAALLLVLPGCLKGTETTTLKKDGSGVYVLKGSFEMEALEGLKRDFGAMSEDIAKFDPVADVDPGFLAAWIAKHKDLELVKAEAKERKDEKGKKRFAVHLEVKFKSLKALYASGIVGFGKTSFALEKSEDGTYTFDRRTAAATMLPKAGDEEGRMMTDTYAEMVKPYLEAIAFSQTLEVPGTITATSGTKAEDGRSVGFSLNWKNLMTRAAHIQTAKFKVDEGVEIEPFKMDLDAVGKAYEALKKFQAEYAAKKKAEATAKDGEKQAAGAQEPAEKEAAGAGK